MPEELDKCIKENEDLISIADLAIKHFREELSIIDIVTFFDKNGIILKNYATPQSLEFYKKYFNISTGILWGGPFLVLDTLGLAIAYNTIVDFIGSEFYLKK